VFVQVITCFTVKFLIFCRFLHLSSVRFPLHLYTFVVDISIATLVREQPGFLLFKITMARFFCGCIAGVVVCMDWSDVAAIKSLIREMIVIRRDAARTYRSPESKVFFSKINTMQIRYRML